MPKGVKYILILLIIGIVASYFVYKFAMKPVADTSKLKTDITITYNNLNTWMTNNDTTKLNKLTNKVIAVSGIIKEVQNEDTLVTVKLGDTTSTNEIICQADKRYITDFKNLSINNEITVKGICSGYASDDLGLGASIQLKNCVKEQ